MHFLVLILEELRQPVFENVGSGVDIKLLEVEDGLSVLSILFSQERAEHSSSLLCIFDVFIPIFNFLPQLVQLLLPRFLLHIRLLLLLLRYRLWPRYQFIYQPRRRTVQDLLLDVDQRLLVVDLSGMLISFRRRLLVACWLIPLSILELSFYPKQLIFTINFIHIFNCFGIKVAFFRALILDQILSEVLFENLVENRPVFIFVFFHDWNIFYVLFEDFHCSVIFVFHGIEA